jgi:cyclophilin family peptidyl-prolyl cis-trans isomerase
MAGVERNSPVMMPFFSQRSSCWAAASLMCFVLMGCSTPAGRGRAACTPKQLQDPALVEYCASLGAADVAQGADVGTPSSDAQGSPSTGDTGVTTSPSTGDTGVTTSPDATDTAQNDATQTQANPQVTLVTSLGEITIELKTAEAPVTTQNFLVYVNDGFYDGDDGLGATTFHRVISGFMVQGGGITADGTNKQTHAAIVNESTNGLLNVRGSVAMARTKKPNSATSQFFINHADNAFLNYANAQEPGYAVFAEVVAGMDVVDTIAALATGDDDVPLQTVTITDVTQ